MRKRGFTILEMAVSAIILTTISGTILALTATGQRLYTSSEHQAHASGRAKALIERMITELRQASFDGEDRDQDNDPDDLDSEDANGNGRIDDDWSLADGETADAISFNAVLRGGLVTDVVTFRFDGERVWRESGSTNPVRAVLATDVTALTFTRQGNRLTINIIVESGVTGDGSAGSSRGGRQVTLLREILIRN